MPNANRPTGLSPVRSLNSPWNGEANVYSIAAGYGTALAIGDAVISSGTASSDGYPGIVLGAATGNLRGVIVGLGRSPMVMGNWGNLDSTVRPASAPDLWYALVVDSPDAIFEVQAATAAATDVGANANLVIGANNGFVSGWTLSSTYNTTALQCRVLGLAPRRDNEFGAFAKLLVRINQHELTQTTGI